MPTCVSDEGTSYKGEIINENEFQLYSGFQKPSVSSNTKGAHFIPSYCKIKSREYQITSIGGYSFIGTQITDIYVPYTVKEIRGAAFESMTSLIKADLSLLEIETIPQYTFANCYNLVYIYLPLTTKTIDDNVFYYSKKLTTILFPEPFHFLDSQAFRDSNALKTVIFCGKHDIKLDLPSSVEKIYVSDYYHEDTFAGHHIQKRTAFCPRRKITCKVHQNKFSVSVHIIISILLFYQH